MIGQTLSQFRITAKLGEGGMGAVYRAEDTKLGRDVAIKVLPEGLTSDPERLTRFEREAKVLASLNHPSIAAIYDLATAEDGSHFLVLELCEGEDLSGRLSRGALPIPEALEIARKIAEALDAAHERGIVHRDLKPANIKITPDGQVKVLDFGLAKMWETEQSDPNLTASPTLTAQMTRAGVILGTAGYMSPEQARGYEVDKRSDIWSLGVILYEMLCGRQAFRGETVTDLIAAVVTQEPDPEQLPSRLPTRARHLLERCLQKDPKQRIRDAGDVRLELEEAMQDPPPTEALTATPGRSPGPLLAATAVVALLLGAAIAWFAKPTAVPEVGQTARFVVEVPHPIDDSGVPQTVAAMSPDGSRLALTLRDSDGTHLYLRNLDNFEINRLPGTENGRSPMFSPDGKSVAFVADRLIKRISAQGGRPVVLTEFAGAFFGGTWISNDQLVVTTAASLTPLLLDAETGEVSEVVVADEHRTTVRYTWPQFLRDDWILCRISEGTGSHVGALNIATGEERMIVRGANAHYLATGHVLWAQDEALLIAPFDVADLTLTDSPQSLDLDVYLGTFGAPYFASSSTASLLYIPARARIPSSFAWVSREGVIQPFAGSDGAIGVARLSPDGRRIVYSPAFEEIAVFDIERQTTTRVGASDLMAYPVWSPDGSRIAFASNLRGGAINTFWTSADGDEEFEPLVVSDRTGVPLSFSPDGKTLLIYDISPDNVRDIWSLEIGGEPEPLVVTAANERAPMFAPDGRWFAYVTDEDGQDEIYIRTFPDSGKRWKASTGGGVEPIWSADGDELFYRVGNEFLSVSVSFAPEPVLGRPEKLFEGSFASDQFGNAAYDFDAENDRFLVVQQAESPLRRLPIILNWDQELKALFASAGD